MDISAIPKRFTVEKPIGQGNFGCIYRAVDLETNQKVAIKLIKRKSGIQELQNEVKILSHIQDGIGIPSLIWSSRSAKYYVMELLGSCINDLFIKQRQILSKSNFVLIAEQLLSRVEFIHSRSVIHRDLKPHQLVLGGPKNKLVYLIDFGLSKMFESSNGTHIPYSEGRAFTGTFNYASLNTHIGLQQSRRDDLESYCYVLSYFYNGDLPWRLSPSTQNETAIKRMKLHIKPSELFGDQQSLKLIFSYIRSLKFDQKPDYFYITSLLEEYKHTLKELSHTLQWSSKRKRSIKTKSKRKKSSHHIKQSKSVMVFNEIVDEMSVTEVNKDYPEFNANSEVYRKKKIPPSIEKEINKSCLIC